jgi:hypothetical protein
MTYAQLILQFKGQDCAEHLLHMLSLHEFLVIPSLKHHRSGNTHLDEALVVDVSKGGHQELAVHAIGDAPMSGDQVVKVLEEIDHNRMT